jgi:uncharacterized protein
VLSRRRGEINRAPIFGVSNGRWTPVETDRMHARLSSAGRISVRLAFTLLVAGAGSAHAAEKAAPKAAPSPAMWKLESGGGKIYLLGSMHILPEKTVWKTPVIEKAIAEADIFVFETKMSDGNTRAAAGIIESSKYLPKGKTLSEMLTPKGQQQLKALAKELQIDFAQLNRLRPWSASLVLSSAAGRHTRVVPGVDMQIGTYSLQNQKPRRYFETGAGQWKIIARMDEAGIKGFEESLSEFGKTSVSFRDMAATWLKGDIEKLDKQGFEGLGSSLVARKILLEERNSAWVEQVPDMLREKRTFFVTVGAAHLAGKGSVIELLCKKGLKPQRVSTATGAVTASCPAGQLASKA